VLERSPVVSYDVRVLFLGVSTVLFCDLAKGNRTNE